MACNYKFNGVSLSEQQFSDLIQSAMENLQKEGATNELVTEAELLHIIAGMGIDQINTESLQQISLLNEQLRDQYEVEGDFVFLNQENQLELNSALIDSLHDTMDGVQDLSPSAIQQEMNNLLFATPNPLTGFSNDPLMDGRFAKMVAYKRSLIARLESQYRMLSAKLPQVSNNSREYDELLKMQAEIQLRLNGQGFDGDADYIPGLKRELVTLMKEKDVYALDNYFFSDAQRLDILLKRNDIDSINEAHKILNFFESLTVIDTDQGNDVNPNQLFSAGELSSTDQDIMDKIRYIQRSASIIYDAYKQKIRKVEISKINEVLANDPFVQSMIEPLRKALEAERIAKGDMSPVSDYDVFFGQMKQDINPWDKFISDAVTGTFSDFGPIPQIMHDILMQDLTEYEGRHQIMMQEMTDLTPKVNQKLSALGYGIKFLKLKNIGASYKAFMQSYRDGNQTGKLIDRRSAEYTDEQIEIADEFNEAFETASLSITSNAASILIRAAYKKRAARMRETSIQLDPRKIKKIREHPEFTEFASFFIEDDTHEAELMNNIQSQRGLDDEIDAQIEKIKRYKSERDRRKRELLSNYGVASVTDLPDEGKAELYKYINQNSPFVAAKYFETDQPVTENNVTYFPNLTAFSTYIPRRKKLGDIINPMRAVGEVMQFATTNVETGYYDPNFSQIESDDDLRAFWKLAGKIHDMRRFLPYQQQRDLDYNMMPSKKKSFQDILTDPNTLIAVKLSAAMHRIYDNLKESISAKVSSLETREELVDTVTQQKEDQVSIGLIKTNGHQIRSSYRRNYTTFLQQLKPGYTDMYKTEEGYFMNRNTTVPYNQLSTRNKETLSQMLGIDYSEKALQKALGLVNATEHIKVGKIIYKATVNEIVSQESYNLPQNLKLYSGAAALYAGRNAAMPMVNLLRKHFESISKPNQNNAGEDATTKAKTKRTRAVTISERKFQKDVLGNITGNVKGKLEKKVYSHEEKKIIDELEAQIMNELAQDEPNENVINSIRSELENMGRNIAFSSFHDRLMVLTRFVGLALSPMGAVKNFMQGKMSNFINGASGLDMKVESMLKGEHIVMGSHIKLLSGRMIKPKGAMILAIMMKRFDLLQDSSNELQKSTVDSGVSVNYSWTNVYVLQQRTEYVNQAPILAGLLVDTMITGKDGTQSSVWDALKGGKHPGELADNFRTDENIKTWELAESSEAGNFTSKVSTVIANHQGDYRRFGGSTYSNDILFKSATMYQRWVGRYVHTRFAAEYTDKALGRKFKGRYRSLSAASGTVFFGATAFALFGGSLLTIGGLGLGALYGYYAGKGSKTKLPMNSNPLINYFQELTLNLAQLTVRSILAPMQIAVTPFTGKRILGKGKINAFIDKGFRESEQDNAYMRSNMAEASLVIMTVMARLMSQALLTDEDEPEEDKTIRNIAMNLAGAALTDLTLFQNPMAIKEQATNFALMRTVENMVKFGDVASQALFEGNSVVISGSHIGESRTFNAFQKTVFPALLRQDFGLGSYSEKLHKRMWTDKFAITEDQKMEMIISQARAEYKKELLQQKIGLITPEKIEKKALELIKADKEGKMSKNTALRKAQKILEDGANKSALRKLNQILPTIGQRKNKKTLTKEKLEKSIESALEKNPVK